MQITMCVCVCVPTALKQETENLNALIDEMEEDCGKVKEGVSQPAADTQQRIAAIAAAIAGGTVPSPWAARTHHTTPRLSLWLALVAKAASSLRELTETASGGPAVVWCPALSNPDMMLSRLLQVRV